MGLMQTKIKTAKESCVGNRLTMDLRLLYSFLVFTFVERKRSKGRKFSLTYI
jgi:hypothetical protein